MARPGIAFLDEPPAHIRALVEKDFTIYNALEAKEAPDQIRGILSYSLSARLDGTVLSQFPNLEIIAHHGVGYDAVDAQWCAEHNIIVTHTPDVLNAEVADLAMALLLATVRQIPQADQYLRAGKWAQAPFPLSASLHGRKLGIFGLGRIGREIARRAEAFGLSIAYHNRNALNDVAYAYYPSLHALAEACDILLLCAPATPETKEIVNAEILNALGPDGIFINIARGSLVKEDDLLAALRSGAILAAGLDVYQNEPAPNPAFASLANTVLLPHVGSASWPTRMAMAKLVVDNLSSYFAGAGPLTPVPETPWKKTAVR
jgi:lactate dehydrogenase-like 2-hydroxyacid dehydrogenase